MALKYSVQRNTAEGSPSLSDPFGFFKVLIRHRVLILRLTLRELESRYKGSFFGILWSLFVPLMFLVVYTYVFSVIFQGKWQLPTQNPYNFAMVLFFGLTLFNLFSESISRAPYLILSNPSYIKRVVFPLEALPWVAVLVSIVNAFISFSVFFLAHLFFIGLPPLTSLCLPLIILPLILIALGITLFLSATCVYVRDLQPLVGVMITLLMFTTPIFYPASAVPERMRKVMSLSPLAETIEQARNSFFLGQTPDAMKMVLLYLAAWGCCWLGYAWFLKTKKGFADVL